MQMDTGRSTKDTPKNAHYFACKQMASGKGDSRVILIRKKNPTTCDALTCSAKREVALFLCYASTNISTTSGTRMTQIFDQNWYCVHHASERMQMKDPPRYADRRGRCRVRAHIWRSRVCV